MKKKFCSCKELKALREALSLQFKINPKQRGDFKKLQEDINKALETNNIRCKGKGGQDEYVRIGETSVQYLWDYRKTEHDHYTSFEIRTLNKFVQCFTPPYKDWTDFTKKIATSPKTSSKNVVFPEDIDVEDLKIGEVITLELAPDYFVKFKYLGDFRFKIIETEGLNRKKGEIIEAVKFIRTSLGCAGNSHATPSILFENKDGTYTDLDTEKEA